MKKTAFWLIIFLWCYLFAEIGCRAYLSITDGAPFFHPCNIIYKYYPEVLPITKVKIYNTDSILDVLILSCSVLHKDWGDINAAMQSQIKLPPQYKSMRVYNASGIGHSSYDNLIKYRLLQDKKFDVVMYYDAINDARLNNCPPEVFKTNYAHYQWYDEINHILAHTEMNITVLPYIAGLLKMKLRALTNPDRYIPLHYSARPQWQKYGENFKTLASYKRNLNAVMDISAKDSAVFLYVTFTYYLPKDYSLEKFRNHTLDYTFCDHSRETEIWGLPQNVVHFINAVDTAGKVLIQSRTNATLVDLNAELPKKGIYFSDVCHLSPQGLNLYAGIVCKRLEQLDIRAKSQEPRRDSQQ